MSRYSSDNGSTVGGIITIICIVLAFVAGYWIRDQGVTVQIHAPSLQRRTK